MPRLKNLEKCSENINYLELGSLTLDNLCFPNLGIPYRNHYFVPDLHEFTVKFSNKHANLAECFELKIAHDQNICLLANREQANRRTSTLPFWKLKVCVFQHQHHVLQLLYYSKRF